MKRLITLLVLFSSTALSKTGSLTLKSFLTGPLTWSTTSVATFAMEVKPFARSSFEISGGFAYEGGHSEESFGDTMEYQPNGEWSVGVAYFYELFKGEKTDFKVFSQIKYYKTGIDYFYYYRNADDQYKYVFGTTWKGHNIFTLGVEPTLHVAKHFTVFTRFGITSYKTLPEYSVDKNAEGFPEKITLRIVKDSVFRIGTTIDTWVVGIGYVF